MTILFQFGHGVVLSVLPFMMMDTLWQEISFGVVSGLIIYYNLAAAVFDYFLQQDRLEAATGGLKTSRRLRESVGAVGLIGCALFFKLFCGVSHSFSVRLAAFLFGLAFLSSGFAGHISALLEVFPRYVELPLLSMLHVSHRKADMHQWWSDWRGFPEPSFKCGRMSAPAGSSTAPATGPSSCLPLQRLLLSLASFGAPLAQPKDLLVSNSLPHLPEPLQTRYK